MEDSLNQSIDNAARHYGSLFKLPSYGRVILLQGLICAVGGLLSGYAFLNSLEFATELLLSVLLLLSSLCFDYVTAALVLKHDPIYDLRRVATLSLFCWGLWFLFIIAGVIFGISLGLSWWIKLCLLGFSAVITLRLIVLRTSASVGYGRTLVAVLVQPFSCLLILLMIWATAGYPIKTELFLFIFASPLVSFASTHFFLSILDREGERSVGVPSLKLFKAFLLNWIAGLNAPFEAFLERLGEEQDIEVSLVTFHSPTHETTIVVPSVHPGPFKNIGSSHLPYLLKDALEQKPAHVACVPSGLQGHELDLASQLQNWKIINQVVDSADFATPELEATPFVEVVSGSATACCQIFGKFVFLSFTLAPSTTEDLPQELGLFVRAESQRRGLRNCVAVNAHNCMDGFVDQVTGLESLKEAATACLEEAASMSRSHYEVGVATVKPKKYSLMDGMGEGGITVIVVRTAHQKTAYVVIDGNNMVLGLREKILSALQLIGIDEGEVFTTDTHSVSAIILGKRGYHPVGEAIDHEELIDYIKKATIDALSDLGRAEGGCRTITIPQVKVIGKKRLETLSILTDRVVRRAKRTVVPIFAFSGLLLTLLLLLV